MAGPGGEPIMTTRVDITGNVAPLQQAVTQAKAEVKKLEVDTAMSGRAGAGGGSGGGVGGAAAQATEAHKKLGDEIGKTEAKSKGLFTTMRTGFALVAGSIALVVLNMQRMVELLADGETRFAKFLKTVEGQSDESRIKSLNEQINTLNNDLRRFESGDPFALWGAGFSRSNIVEALQLAEKDAEATQNRINAARVKADTTSKAATVENLKAEEKALEQLLMQQLTGADRVRAEEAAAIREVEAKREGASKEAQAIYDKQRDAIVSNANAQIRALNNETREREKQARESAERQAKALADAYAGAFDRIRAESANAFPAERLIGSIETMIERLEALADQRSRLRG
jgi:hypothetical protein